MPIFLAECQKFHFLPNRKSRVLLKMPKHMKIRYSHYGKMFSGQMRPEQIFLRGKKGGISGELLRYQELNTALKELWFGGSTSRTGKIVCIDFTMDSSKYQVILNERLLSFIQELCLGRVWNFIKNKDLNPLSKSTKNGIIKNVLI